MIFIIFIHLLITSLVLLFGVAIGFILRWIFPEINLEMGILIGVIVTGITAYLHIKLNSAVSEFDDENVILDEDRSGGMTRFKSLSQVGSRKKKRSR